MGCLVLHQRYKRRVENYLSLTKELSSESIVTKDTVINDDERTSFLRNENGGNVPNGAVAGGSVSIDDENEAPRNRIRAAISSQESQSTSSPVVPDIEDLFKSNDTSDKALRTGKEFCSSSFACSGPSRQHCQDLVRDYRQQQHLEFIEFYNNIQSLRHTVLLILLLCSMFVVSTF